MGIPPEWLEVCQCLEFSNVVCVGSSQCQWMDVSNRGDRWIQVTLLVAHLTRDGQEVVCVYRPLCINMCVAGLYRRCIYADSALVYRSWQQRTCKGVLHHCTPHVITPSPCTGDLCPCSGGSVQWSCLITRISGCIQC